MKRQVAITGPTPEFLRWSIRQSCPLRADTEIDSIDQTEKRLRAVRTAALAIAQNRVFDGIAARYFDSQLKGFRLSEVFEVFGGFEESRKCCGSCAANVLNIASIHGSMAGCHGWLKRRNDTTDLCELIEATLDQEERRMATDIFLATDPVWYGLWADGNLQGDHLSFVADLFNRIQDCAELFGNANDFVRVLDVCVRQKLVLDVELVPPGFSDGLRWTISRHCDRCKSTFGLHQNRCRSCGKPGQGHPEIHRKVLGLRPWVDMAVVIGPDNVSTFLKQNKIDRIESEESL